MKKTAILVLCSLVLLILAGCGGGSQPQLDGTIPNPYYGGSRGVEATFEEVDDEIYLGGGIPIIVLLENRGEYVVPANSMALKLQGISVSDFNGIDSRTLTNFEEIDKISEFNPDGGVSSIDFGTAVFNRGEIEGDKYLASIFVEYIYPYQTAITVTNVCVKGDIKDEAICPLDGSKQAFSSGGPIQLAGSVTQKRAGNGKIQIDIPIKNVGDGDAALRVGGAGDPGKFSPDFDEVNFRAADTDGEWECSAKGRVDKARLSIDETVVVKCTLDDIPLDQRTIEKFTLVVDYYYRDIINTEVLIREE